jgi:P pilus assembly chaperone PapD
MMQYRILALATAFTALLFLAPQSAPADLGLDVSPAKMELSMPPGSSYNIPVTVRNGTTTATHIQATLVDFGVTQSGDYKVQRVGSRSDSLMRWASINPREFDLDPNTTQQVRLSLAIPNSTSLSGEYAGIAFFQTRPTRRAPNAVAFSVRIATKIYVTIPGTVKVAGAITKMSAVGRGGPELYHILFQNTGNAHVYVRGELDVQKDGATVERIPVPGEMLVERGGERLIELTGNALPPGKYQAIATLDYGGKTMTGGEIVFERS